MLSIMTISKEFTFEAAHRLLGYNGACVNLHGHSYKLIITLQGPVDTSTNMVMDFSEVKKWVNDKIISKVDHALILNSEDPLADILSGNELKIVLLNGNPTAENMLAVFLKHLGHAPLKGIHIDSLKLYETATSYAECFPITGANGEVINEC